MALPEKQVVAGPHSVSLKVLRLSKPSLAHADVLPEVVDHANLRNASLAYPSQHPSAFPLTPLLTLPPSFGAAYVGEQFACTLCANNERPSSGDNVQITDVRIQAELQTPSTQPKGEEVQIEQPQHHGKKDEEETLVAGSSIQWIVRHDLKEEGMHVLAVMVTYTESTADQEPRTRTFRKMYQFAAQQALGVRTKIAELARKPGYTGGRMFALEAQIENLADQSVLLDGVNLVLGKGLKSIDMNDHGDKTVLMPQDVEQVAFTLIAEAELEENAGRFVLAQMTVDWKLAMGQDGVLRTDWLGCRKR